MKGHTKIELFNAKTGKLEKTVEDNNMFTNALNSLLNDNIGGDLSDPADIFPLPEKALGGLMLLPEAETEDANNLFPHSFPTATGVYGRTDISNNSMMGVYNAERSGYSPNKESYTHVWEFPTHQGNGTIACAALTHKSGVDKEADVNIRGEVKFNSPIENAKRSNYILAGFYDGYIYTARVKDNNFNQQTNPSFVISRFRSVEEKMGSLKDKPFNTFLNDTAIIDQEDVFEITLSLNYGDYFCYHIVATENGKFLILISKGTISISSPYYSSDNYYLITSPFVDVHEVNIATRSVSFLKTLNMPIYNSSTGTAQITESGRDIVRETYHTISPMYGDSYYTGTDYHLCMELIFVRFSENPTEALPDRRSNISRLLESGNIIYKDGNLLFTPSCFDSNVDNRLGGLRLGLCVKMNILTNEFTLIKGNDTSGLYPLIQLTPNGNLISFGDNIIVDMDNNRVFNSALSYRYIWLSQAVSARSVQHTNIHGIYSDIKTGGGSGNSNTDYLYLIRSRNNMYLATINNLSQPITKSSEQTMRVTYTISNEV